ncbi:MAG: L-aspartate oxidase [Lachnospiraceae bacterium]|nr:L-aspartate oxidase [Lachnospiraceae bacterium]
MKNDIIIAGCGVGGLYAALNLPEDKNIVIITKDKAENCDSFLAQGGICMQRDDEDYDSYFEDTLRAGHYENRQESVDIMIRSSRDIINDLISYGVDFQKDENGELSFTREGAHSKPRILYHEDITGEEITSKLLAEVRKRKNIRIYEYVSMIDIIEYKGKVRGVIASSAPDNELALNNPHVKADNGSLVFELRAPEVIWATGGIGGLYAHSTNYPHLTGDALAIALKHNIPLENPDYVQIHPTTLFSNKKGRAFLISESVRGEGAILLDKNNNRFVDELLPRDVVSHAIFEQMEKDNTEHVWLSMAPIPREEILTHFKHIYEECLKEGYDCTKEPIPVVPAQHYFMGGVHVDKYSETSLKHLYAVGETSCNGVHGANRLASNSLLESLVFAKRAALKISHELENIQIRKHNIVIDLNKYTNLDKIAAGYALSVNTEIERMRLYHEQHNNDIKHRPVNIASA